MSPLEFQISHGGNLASVGDLEDTAKHFEKQSLWIISISIFRDVSDRPRHPPSSESEQLTPILAAEPYGSSGLVILLTPSRKHCGSTRSYSSFP